jgi:hypothetical protein
MMNSIGWLDGFGRTPKNIIDRTRPSRQSGTSWDFDAEGHRQHPCGCHRMGLKNSGLAIVPGQHLNSADAAAPLADVSAGATAGPVMQKIILLSLWSVARSISQAGFLVSHAHEFERIKTPYGNVLVGKDDRADLRRCLP